MPEKIWTISSSLLSVACSLSQSNLLFSQSHLLYGLILQFSSILCKYPKYCIYLNKQTYEQTKSSFRAVSKHGQIKSSIPWKQAPLISFYSIINFLKNINLWSFGHSTVLERWLCQKIQSRCQKLALKQMRGRKTGCLYASAYLVN